VSQLGDLTDAIVTALAAAHTTYDLSRTGAVRRGRFAEPPGGAYPFAWVSPAQVTSEQGPTFHHYTREVVIDVGAWAQPTAQGLESAADAADALTDDLITALEAARSTQGNALYGIQEFAVDAAALAGDEAHLPPYGAFVLLVVRMSYHRQTGV